MILFFLVYDTSRSYRAYKRIGVCVYSLQSPAVKKGEREMEDIDEESRLEKTMCLFTVLDAQILSRNRTTL